MLNICISSWKKGNISQLSIWMFLGTHRPAHVSVPGVHRHKMQVSDMQRIVWCQGVGAKNVFESLIKQRPIIQCVIGRTRNFLKLLFHVISYFSINNWTNLGHFELKPTIRHKNVIEILANQPVCHHVFESAIIWLKKQGMRIMCQTMQAQPNNSHLHLSTTRGQL